MSQMQTETVATHDIDGVSIDVVGYYDDTTPDGEFDWYDLFDNDNGVCLNEGEPFHSEPDFAMVEAYCHAYAEAMRPEVADESDEQAA